MTNKDTVYSYARGYYLGFIYGDPKSYHNKGCSLKVNGGFNYFEWTATTPKDLRPVGQRCILQWQ